jgi:hypothetical protein
LKRHLHTNLELHAMLRQLAQDAAKLAKDNPPPAQAELPHDYQRPQPPVTRHQ